MSVCVGNDIITGTFFIAGDNGDKELVSLSEQQIKEYSNKFYEVEDHSHEEMQDKIRFKLYGLKLGKKEKKKVKYLEIKIKYPDTRIRALRFILAKKNTTIEAEMRDALYQLYKKNVKLDVREFIEEMEEQANGSFKKPKSA